MSENGDMFILAFSDFFISAIFYCGGFDFRKGRDILQTRITEFRKKSGVTQEELADAVSVTRQTIISLESGKYKASLVLAHKLAQFFNVTIEEMFVFDKEDENI